MAQQNLDFNIVAHTKGMEAIATLINRVGALEAETKKLASANASLSASTDTVVRNGVRYNNAIDAQSKQLRQARQGTQQLGMQINDFATSVSTGASVTQAFSQQIGQVGYAMSQMQGAAGKVGSFLAGPWGALVLVGAMALSPLIEKLYQTMVSANKAEGALAGLMKRRAQELAGKNEIVDSEKGLAALVKRRGELEDAIAKKGRRDSQGRLMFVYAEQKALAEVNANIAAGRDAIDAARTSKMGLGLESVTRDLYKPQNVPEAKTSGSGASKVAETARKLKKDQEEAAKYITDVNIKADKEWRDYWVKAEGDQTVGLQEKLKDMETMATATIETVGQAVGPLFLDRFNEIQTAFANIGMSVNNAFKGMVTGATSWKDAMRGIIGSVIDELWRLYVVQQIVGFITKAIGGISGNPGANIDSAITVTRGRAVGGYVGAQTPYVVGEKGPELFVPGGSGTIIPNKNMGMNGGGGGMVVNVDARGSSDPAAVRAQVEAGILQAAPAIIAAAQQRTVSSLRRPRLGGAMQ